MFGTRIVMDEEKILREGKYQLKDIYNTIDELAKQCKLVKKDKYTYICPRGRIDSQMLGIFHTDYLRQFTWFTLNVKEWTFLDDKEGNTDMIAFSKKRNRGVWND